MDTKKIILIVVIVLVVLCCCTCVGLSVAGFAAFQFMPQETRSFIGQEESTLIPEDILPFEEETFTAPEDVQESEQPEMSGLGVSRDEMIDFFNSGDAFVFEDPIDFDGFETVTGTHTWLCVEDNCAAVTLGGSSAEDLSVVSVVAPTDRGDDTQTTTAITLLMNAANHFCKQNSSIPMQMMSDLFKAQSANTSFENKLEENGVIYNESYDPDSGMIFLTITRSK